MANNINLLRLYQQTFGYVALPFARSKVAAVVPEASAFAKIAAKDLGAVQRSMLGTPMFMPTTLDGIQLPNEPIVTIRGGKKVIETEFDGNDGSFKEIFTLRDYNIEIAGIAVSDNPDEYPTDIMRQIRELCEKRRGASLKVVSDQMTLFNITNLVIYDFDFPGVPGELEMQGYLLKCKSDKSGSLVIGEL